MVLLIIIQFIVIGGLLWFIKSRDDQAFALQESKINTSENFLRTVATGLAYRFKPLWVKEEGQSETAHPPLSELFIQQSESDFVKFASTVVQRIHGGTVYLTGHADEHSQFEIERADGTYLGVAIAAHTDVRFEPIALLHSELIKQHAQGGYLVTTSDFTTHARRYARNLGVELINGRQLAIYWIEQMEAKRYDVSDTTKTKRTD